MSLKAVAPVTALQSGTGARSKKPETTNQRISDAMNMRHKTARFNNLPLWEAARESELRSLPLDAKRLARRFGLDASTARLLAALAGHKRGERS